MPHPSRVRRAALLVVLAAALPASACFRRTVAAPERYRLRGERAAPPTTTATTASAGAAGGEVIAAVEGPTLTVEPYATPGLYGDRQIVYREGETRYGSYPNREWAIPLGTMLAALTAETLDRQPALAGRVQDGGRAGGRDGLVWRGVVREFEEVDRGGQVYAAVRLGATLVRARDDSVLWTGSARAEQLVGRTTDMTVVVDSLSSLAARVVATLSREAAPAVRAAAR